MFECLTTDAKMRIHCSSCDPDWSLGDCSPEDSCGPDYDVNCMPDCHPDE